MASLPFARRTRLFAITSLTAISLMAVEPASPASAAAPQAQGAPAATAPIADQATLSRAFLRAAARPSGAIASHSDQTFIDPYLANQGVRGLAASCTPDDRAVAMAYLRWYAAHSEAGVVHDYLITPDGEVSTDDEDSQDAYAGSFLSAVAAMHASGNAAERAALLELRPAVAEAIGLIESLQDSDGLTWAKPTWRVKYLMDQVEVYWGLVEILPTIRDDSALSQRARAATSRLASGVETLWQPEIGTYAQAKHEDGTVIPSDPGRRFPDALSQVWLVNSDLAPSKRVARIMATVGPTLDQLTDPLAWWDPVGTGDERVGYWPLLASAWSRVGNSTAAQSYLTAMYEARWASAEAWPYNVAIAGMLAAPRGVPLPDLPRCR